MFAQMSAKNLYIIAGCNGAGKTTASFTILPEILHCDEFVNADEIARGISPFHPEGVAIEAGRVMQRRIAELIHKQKSFAFETTLSGKAYQSLIKTAKENGYHISLLYFWLQSVELACERVRIRVKEGGHDIKPDVIGRRYKSGIQNLFSLYLPIVDEVFIMDNSYIKHELIARKKMNGDLVIIDLSKFKLIEKWK